MDLGIHSGFGAVFQIFLSSCVQGHPTTWVGVFQIFFKNLSGAQRSVMKKFLREEVEKGWNKWNNGTKIPK